MAERRLSSRLMRRDFLQLCARPRSSWRVGDATTTRSAPTPQFQVPDGLGAPPSMRWQRLAYAGSLGPPRTHEVRMTDGRPDRQRRYTRQVECPPNASKIPPPPTVPPLIYDCGRPAEEKQQPAAAPPLPSLKVSSMASSTVADRRRVQGPIPCAQMSPAMITAIVVAHISARQPSLFPFLFAGSRSADLEEAPQARILSQVRQTERREKLRSDLGSLKAELAQLCPPRFWPRR
jgi:hypothetical protein